MEAVRLGVVGCGVIGPSHLELAAKGETARVVAVADLIEERARSVAKRFGVPKVYRSDVELLADREVEAVVLAMPVADRTPAAYRALEAGKHVLLEKPIAANAAEVRTMMELRGDRVVGCCSPRNTFTGHAQAAARCVASGALGRIRLVRVRAILSAPPSPNPDPPPWRQSMRRNGGGILVNWSCYDLDYLMYIAGWQVKPVAVTASWWPIAPEMASYVAPGSDADSHYIALVRCEDGVALSMERGEFTSAVTDQAWEIIGTRGTLHLPMRPQTGKPVAVVLDRFLPGRGIVTEELWKSGDPDPGDNILTDFAGAIREGRETRTGLERALAMQKVTDAIYRSAATGASVAL